MNADAHPDQPPPPGVECAIASDRLAQRVAELASQISTDYHGRPLLVVGVLKGAWVFMADLVRALTIPVHCDFVRLASYGPSMSSSGQPKLLVDLDEPVERFHVLLVEDLVDTGVSAAWLLEHLQRKNPRSLRLCALLDKPGRRRQEVRLDYVGFEIPDRFVVGYGIDYAEQFRYLPYIGYVSDESHPAS